MMKRKARQSRLMKILTSPLRAFSKARDMYVSSMNQYANRVPYGSAGAWGLPAADHLARSFSVNSIRSGSRMSYEEADDLRGLIRSASAKSYGDRIDLKGCLAVDQAEKQRPLMGGTKAAFGGSRSSGVGMAKIDEDRALEEEEDEEDESQKKGKKAKVGRGGTGRGAASAGGGVPAPLYPRSKSCAVSSMSNKSR